MIFFVVLIALGLWTTLFRVLPNRRLTPITSYWLPAIIAVVVAVASISRFLNTISKKWDALPWAKGAYPRRITSRA